MEQTVTIADLERQLGQMVVQLIAKDKVIEAQAQRIDELTPKPDPKPDPKPEAEQEK